MKTIKDSQLTEINFLEMFLEYNDFLEKFFDGKAVITVNKQPKAAQHNPLSHIYKSPSHINTVHTVSCASNALPCCLPSLHRISSVSFSLLQYIRIPTGSKMSEITVGSAVSPTWPTQYHAAIACANHSLSKCGIDTEYTITNVKPAASEQLQAFIMYRYIRGSYI